MLAFTREKIVEHLQEIPKLVDVYQRRDSVFVERVINWLITLEESLGQLRHPLVSFVATERGKLVALTDGYCSPQLYRERLSKGKISMASTLLVLDEVQQALNGIIKDIDIKFDMWREKMSQFLAVATIKNPIPLPPTEPRSIWLEKVWTGFKNGGNETQGMYAYLNTSMRTSDRLYLLDELMENLLNHS